MGAEPELLSALTSGLWTYASLILPEDEMRALETAVRQVGGRRPGRIPAPQGHGPDSFALLLETAFSSQGGSFLHHAGYYCGGQVARHFVTSARHPTDAAVRLVDAVVRSIPGLQFVADAPDRDRLDFTVGSKAALPRSVTEFASGFVKGAAARINEGTPPLITERVEQGDRNWVVSIQWAAPPGAPVKGGSRTRRK